jgi:hypothetical protein
MFRKILFALFVACALAAGVTAVMGLTPARVFACVPGVDC